MNVTLSLSLPVRTSSPSTLIHSSENLSCRILPQKLLQIVLDEAQMAAVGQWRHNNPLVELLVADGAPPRATTPRGATPRAAPPRAEPLRCRCRRSRIAPRKRLPLSIIPNHHITGEFHEYVLDQAVGTSVGTSSSPASSQSHHPSAGFFALVLASLRCEKVALYGFRQAPHSVHPHYKYYHSKAPLRHLRGADDAEAVRQKKGGHLRPKEVIASTQWGAGCRPFVFVLSPTYLRHLILIFALLFSFSLFPRPLSTHRSPIPIHATP